jgi:hypothetical protein
LLPYLLTYDSLHIIFADVPFVLPYLLPSANQKFPIYDAMVTLLPVNFIALGIIGGGIASTLKRFSGIDIRGRILEIIVVVLTLLLTGITSGLVRGYFGDPSRCWGLLASSLPDKDIEGLISKRHFHPTILNTVLIDIPLAQMKLWHLKWDYIFSKLGFVSRRFLCFPSPDGNTDYSTVGCSPSTRSIDTEFYLKEGCSADMSLVLGVWISALFALLLGNVYRHLRGARRHNVAVVHRGQRRPHQD